MWGLLAVHLIIILLFLILGWAVRKKEGYWLISGFSSRTKEEQEELIRSGYPQKVGSLLIITALGMLILLPLMFTSFKFAMEVQFGFMIIFLMGGMIYLTKYEVPNKRKRSYIISITLFITIIGGMSALSYFSYQGYELVTKEESFEVTGMYGDEWKYEDITSIELMEKMPEVTVRINGVGLPALSKGHFKVTGYGSSLLFIQKGSSPYIFIELKDERVFINDKNPEQTRLWFEQVREQAELTQ
ncbi:hypothetical protein F4694_006099 [Bacillus niacini]|uniref:Bacterial Pleckstrin homology domain-containing protein n=1 Tax=Neobacillus niacini TaxID=86668 RepID=A0A852TKF3_9BACI|nr:DUF3784 domain-containing protein [Neobacillus niacini]NYE09242.1 hypothetical protein [Neobacillus niacini]